MVVVMENTALKKAQFEVGVDPLQSNLRRKRCLTTLKMQWVAERIRKCKRIQKEIASGSYKVDSCEVAKAILNYNRS